MTVTAKDSSGNTADGTNSGTAFTGIVFLTTNATTYTPGGVVANITSGGTKILNNAFTFGTVESGVTVSAENNGGSISGTSDSITVSQGGDVTPPTVSTIYPANGSTDVGIGAIPTITFSESMDINSLATTTIQLRKSEDDSVVAATVTIANGGKTAWIYTDDYLDYDTSYYLYAGTGATDTAGNALAEAYGSALVSEFTTTALGNGTLEVTSIVASSTRTYATADDTYENGWAWTFNITVPTTETSFKMKFADWKSGSNTIEAADNIKYYTAQGDYDSASNAISIGAAATYPDDAITIDTDLDASTAGWQIQVVVEAKVPDDSAGGSYSTSYGVYSIAIE